VVNQLCTDTCDKEDQLALQLGCMTSGSQCATTCQSLYTMSPQCSSMIDGFFMCVAQQATTQNCQCDLTMMNHLTCSGICITEAQAFVACISSGVCRYCPPGYGDTVGGYGSPVCEPLGESSTTGSLGSSAASAANGPGGAGGTAAVAGGCNCRIGAIAANDRGGAAASMLFAAIGVWRVRRRALSRHSRSPI
jgi:hypothetical protein